MDCRGRRGYRLGGPGGGAAEDLREVLQGTRVARIGARPDDRAQSRRRARRRGSRGPGGGGGEGYFCLPATSAAPIVIERPSANTSLPLVAVGVPLRARKPSMVTCVPTGKSSGRVPRRYSASAAAVSNAP